MKDVTVKITGRQCFDGREEDQMEFVTEGRLYLRNGAMFIVYDESELSGMEGVRTTLLLKGDTVKMHRNSISGFSSELFFRRGERFSSTYDTPYGSMGVEVLTSKVENRIDMEEMAGDVDIEYNVSLNGLAEGKNKLTISVN